MSTMRLRRFLRGEAWTTMAVLGIAAGTVSGQGMSLDDLTQVRPATSGRVSSANPEPWSNADNRWIKPGEVFTMADLKGPGVIRHIWITFPESNASWIAKGGSAAPDELVLRMYWDGAEQPAVEAPLGDFFAAGFGKRAEVNSLPVQVQGGDSYNCFWAMPYFNAARITLTNESEKTLAAFYYHVDYTKEKELPGDTAYFCAQYRQELPALMGRDYLIADIEGPGHYVGTVLSVRSRSPQWFGEGDDKFYIDGDAKPTLFGTGTEDYFLGAWGFQKASMPSFGVPVVDGWLAEVGDTGSMFRWHLADPVRFTESLRFEIEHKGWISADETTTGKVEGHVEREDDFASVAFWYQRGQPKRFATLPPMKDRKLPPIDIVIEAKDLLATAKTSGGDASIQAGPQWTGDGQLFFDGQEALASIECSFTVEKAEYRRLVLAMTHSYDFGKYFVELDGQSLGFPIDLYSPTIEVRQHHLGDFTLAPGTHTLRLRCHGNNSASAGFKMGLDALRLRQRWTTKRPPLEPTWKQP